jgi:hypothetical protein
MGLSGKLYLSSGLLTFLFSCTDFHSHIELCYVPSYLGLGSLYWYSYPKMHSLSLSPHHCLVNSHSTERSSAPFLREALSESSDYSDVPSLCSLFCTSVVSYSILFCIYLSAVLNIVPAHCSLTYVRIRNVFVLSSTIFIVILNTIYTE